jgi:hypothetical protein
MKEDLNSLYDQLQNNLSPSSSSLGGVVIGVSFLEAISVVFLLVVIFRYYGDSKHEEHIPEQIEMNKHV